ncbi:hypothetical protein BKA70DRAFT_609421 [Coprinopsis sp. MPI-PUGE-AT-0042]|nr:hypothetical protein BKA70DRAFT_609421 [Coprinopsis sp. MPI-PUGE-AT-0042]
MAPCLFAAVLTAARQTSLLLRAVGGLCVVRWNGHVWACIRQAQASLTTAISLLEARSTHESVLSRGFPSSAQNCDTCSYPLLSFTAIIRIESIGIHISNIYSIQRHNGSSQGPRKTQTRLLEWSPKKTECAACSSTKAVDCRRPALRPIIDSGICQR